MTIAQDTRYAIRSLVRTPAFTIVAALTLALGIGANTAIFSVLYSVLLRPLPYPEPERLVGLAESFRGNSGETSVTFGEYQFLARQNTIFEALGASASVGLNLYTGTEAERVTALRVNADYFKVYHVNPALGRTFSADEDAPGGPDAVILSHGVWQRRFGGDATVIGRSVSLNGRPFVVVGIMPDGFHSEPDAQVWSTLAQVASTVGSGQNIELIARLKPGLTFEQARAQFIPTIASYRTEFARMLSKDVALDLAPYRDLIVQDVRTPVRVLFGAIGFVLLIACANVANLLLGRTAGRGREIAVRVAMGATRGRLLRQLITESVVLALLAGVIGLGIASAGVGALVRFAPQGLLPAGNCAIQRCSASSSNIHLDALSVVFTFAVALVTGLAFGAVPAWQVAGADLHGTLKEGSGRVSGTSRQARLRRALVVAEMALSLVLLVGAGLLVQTFSRLIRTDAGFETGHVLSAQIWLSGSHFDSTAKIAAFYGRLADRVSALPGVQSVGVVEAGLPLQRGGNLPVQVPGNADFYSTDYRTVAASYFQTLGIQLRRGRVFTAADAAGAAPAFVVNESFARRYLGGDSALGRSLHLGGQGGVDGEVVGIVGDVRSFIGSPARPTVFLASAQTPVGFTRIFAGWFPIHVLVRTSGDPATLSHALEQAIRELDSEVPVGEVRSMSAVLAASLSFQRFTMMLLGSFAVLAIVLASVGLYGVIAYLVSQRTHEIGVRMALGARTTDVVRMVLGGGMALAGMGVVVGLIGAALLTRLLANQLYGVKALDPLTFGLGTALLVTVAFAACWIPARRASKTDPIVALRSE